jgi:hypothetical protein
MNSTANGRPVVPRTGYIVEFNALWYNALEVCAADACRENIRKNRGFGAKGRTCAKIFCRYIPQ